MRLNAQSDYALRCMMYLCVNDDRLCTVSEIANHFDLSTNHMVKVVHTLGVAGFVETVRGRNGGLRIAGSPKKIRVGDVVRTTEADFALVECFRDESECIIGGVCKLERIVSDALAAFISVLNRYYVADLVSKNKKLHTILHVPPHEKKPSGKRR